MAAAGDRRTIRANGMGAVTAVIERHQHRTILEQTRSRELSIGASLTALNKGYLLSYNSSKLEQVDVENIVGALR
jgi:hypothetical protein